MDANPLNFFDSYKELYDILFNKYGKNITDNDINTLAHPEYTIEIKELISNFKSIIPNDIITIFDDFLNRYNKYNNYIYKYIKSLYYLVLFNYDAMIEYIKTEFININMVNEYITNEDYFADIMDEYGYICILIADNYPNKSSYDGIAIINLLEYAKTKNNPFANNLYENEYNRLTQLWKIPEIKTLFETYDIYIINYTSMLFDNKNHIMQFKELFSEYKNTIPDYMKNIFNDYLNKYYLPKYNNYLYKYLKALCYLVIFNYDVMFEYIKTEFIRIKEGKNYITHEDYYDDIIDNHGYIYLLIAVNYAYDISYTGNVIIDLFKRYAKKKSYLAPYYLGKEYNRIGTIYESQKNYEMMFAYYEEAIYNYGNYESIDAIINIIKNKYKIIDEYTIFKNYILLRKIINKDATLKLRHEKTMNRKLYNKIYNYYSKRRVFQFIILNRRKNLFLPSEIFELMFNKYIKK